MSAEILQEYLVRVGYHIDPISQRKFEEGLSASGKKVLGVGTALTAMTAAMATATAAFAYDMRKMYFAAELGNTTVKNLRSMEFAGKQIGVSGDAMASAIHNMAQAIRLEPGITAFIQSLGVQVTGRDASDVVKDLVQALNKMPEYQASGIMQDMFGMDPDTYHQMRTHFDEFIAQQEKINALYRQHGVDIDAAKTNVMHYANEIDSLKAKLNLTSDAMLLRFLPAFDDAATKLGESANWWTDWARGINHVGDAFDEELPKMQGFFSFLNDSAAAKFFYNVGRTGENVVGFIGDSASRIRDSFGNKSAIGANSAGGHEDIVNFFVGKGWTKQQAIGIAANLYSESAFNPNQIGDGGSAVGVAQWHPDRQAEFKRLYGKDLKGSSLHEQLEFIQYELTKGKEINAGMRIAGSKTAYDAAYNGSLYYERPALGTEEANKRGKLAQGFEGSFSQNNTFNITGGNASEIADSVSNKINKTWSTVSRNLKSAVD